MFSFDEEDISSPHSLKVTRRLIKKSKSPGGTERVVGTKDFNFKKLPEGPSQRERDSCRRLQSQARERAKIQLSPERKKAANAKRLKGPGGAAVAAAEGAVHAGDAPASSSLGDMLALGTASPDFANLRVERNRQRDWAILRGFKAGLEAHTILTELRKSKLLEDGPWSGVAVTERHAEMVAAISVVQDLMGLDDPMHVMCALFDLSDR